MFSNALTNGPQHAGTGTPGCLPVGVLAHLMRQVVLLVVLVQVVPS